MIMDWIHIALAGLWGEVWRYGLGVGAIIYLLAAAYFSPILKKEFCWAAGVVAAFLVAFTMGVSVGEKRVQAQWDASIAVTISQGEKARRDADAYVERDPAGSLFPHDRFNRDNK